MFVGNKNDVGELRRKVSLESGEQVRRLPDCAGCNKDIKYNNVKVSLESIEGVVAAHSLHIWSLTVNKAALSVHLAIGWYSEL